MNRFYEGQKQTFSFLASILLLGVVLSGTGHAASQQNQPGQPPEKRTADCDGLYGVGPGPDRFDPAREGRELTVDQVRTELDCWLARIGNPRLKIGNIIEKDPYTITAEIVTIDNSLVEKVDIDRRAGVTGYPRQPGFWMPHHWNSPWGMGWGPSMRGWMPFPFFGIFFIILMGAFVAGLMSLLFRYRRHGWRDMEQEGYSPLEALNKRYARGEISQDEYLQRKRELLK